MRNPVYDLGSHGITHACIGDWAVLAIASSDASACRMLPITRAYPTREVAEKIAKRMIEQGKAAAFFVIQIQGCVEKAPQPIKVTRLGAAGGVYEAKS